MEQNAPSLKCGNGMPHPPPAVAGSLQFAGKQGKHLVSLKGQSNCSPGAWPHSSLPQMLQMPGASVAVVSERDRDRLSLTCSHCSSSFCRRLLEEGMCILVNISVLFNCPSFHPSISFFKCSFWGRKADSRTHRVAHNLL